MKYRFQKRAWPFLFLFLLGTIFLVSNCALNPVSKKRELVLMSEAQEIELGQKTDPQIIEEYGYYEDSDLQDYVNSVGQNLARVCDRPEIYYRFKVCNSPVINAFALPGGYVYVDRGLLALLNSEAELAGVLGHEIGHICARHHIRRYTKETTYQIITEVVSIFVPETRNVTPITDLIALAVIRGFGREYELEADRLGMKYASRAGYDMKALETFLNTLKRMEEQSDESDKPTYHGLFSTHPETEKRVNKSLEEMEKSEEGNKKVNGVILSERYKSRIDGLLYGSDPREGVVVNNIFRHPMLRFEVAFPPAWKINNEKTMLSAKHPKKEYFIQMRVGNLGKKVPVENLAKKISRQIGIKKIEGSTVEINALSAYLGIYRGRERRMGKVSLVAAFIIMEDKIYQMFGFSKPHEFKEARHYFDKTIHSFKEISRKEAQAIKPNRIKIYTAKEGDTLEKIAQESGREPDYVKKLAILNNLTIDEQLGAGDTIKIITNE